MKFSKKIKNALEFFSEKGFEHIASLTDNNKFVRPAFTKMTELTSSAKKVNELESLVSQLNEKITILVDKVVELDSQILHLTTIHEELMYTIDQQVYEFEHQEDNLSDVKLNSKEKKYGMN